MRIQLLSIILLVNISAYAVRFPEEAKRNCQMMDSIHGMVTLIFATDSAHFALPPDSFQSVWVSGSINDLQDTMAGYQLDQWSEDSCFYHTFTCDELAKPGNSGQPEFVFWVVINDSTGANYYGYDLKQVKMDERLLCYNGVPYTMIVLPCGADYFTTDLDELGARCEAAKEIRPLSDFDLTDSVDQHQISNFRRVPATTQLYRSYHPYYPSTPKHDTEQQRLYWVSKLSQQMGIQSDISLTGDLSSKAGQWYVCGGDSFQITIPDYLQTAMDSGHVCYVGKKVGKNPSVVECYYHSDELLLAQYIKEIVEFINDPKTPLPIQIHCALGADRTGMVCAVLAALCGADWAAIQDDYQQTSNMKIQTYRHPNRLIYALERMTGLRPDQCTSDQLSAAIRNHLVNTMKVLTNEQINYMVERLTQQVSTTLGTILPATTNIVYWSIMGRKVNQNHRGVIIQNGEKYLLMQP